MTMEHMIPDDKIQRLSPAEAAWIKAKLVEIERRLDDAGLNGAEEVARLWLTWSRPTLFYG